MEKQFIPYEQALELKELGFDRPCFLKIQYSSGIDIFTGSKFKNSIWLGNGYDAQIDGKKIKYEYPLHSDQKYGELKIPTFSQAFRWFREKYKNLHGSIEQTNSYKDEYTVYIGTFGYIEGNLKDEPKVFISYEEAELECLKKLIEIVKQQKK